MYLKECKNVEGSSLTDKIVKYYTTNIKRYDTVVVTSGHHRLLDFIYKIAFEGISSDDYSGETEFGLIDLEKTFKETKKRLEDIQKYLTELMDRFGVVDTIDGVKPEAGISAKIGEILPIIGKYEQLYMSGITAKEKIHAYWESEAMIIITKMLNKYKELKK